MDLEHRFTVAVPVDVAWAALEDLPTIAPCFPGAEISDFDGDAFSGSCRVKLGPVSLQYQGTGRFVERDPAGRRAVVEARGKERRGNGTASATVTTRLAADGDTSTDVTVSTDLTVTGRPAQFGRGMMQEVGDRLLTEFARCLEQTLVARSVDEAVAAGTEQNGEAQPTHTGSPMVPAALDLGRAVGPVLLRRAAPYVAAGAVAVAVLLIARRRGR